MLNVQNAMNYQFILMLIFSVQISIGSSNSTFRKHKVHNIALYPDKHSWCTSTSIKQVISDVDCDPVEIENRVCLGACFSYSIPKTHPANNADEINSYCDSCQPIKTTWLPVQLTCGNGLNHTKHVQLITKCRCSSCNRHWEYENPLTNDVDEDAEVSIGTSRYSEKIKIENNENANSKETNSTAVANTKILQNVANSTGLVYERKFWIRGPHHSKVLLRKEMNVSKNVTNDTQQHSEE